jgi:replication factor A1
MTDITQQAQDIHEQLPETTDVTTDDIEARLDTLVNDYQVPIEEARRTVLNTYLEDTDTDPDDIQNSNESVDLATIDDDEQWVDITAKVADLWEPRSDSIAQVGLLGDETGTIKFTKWAKSDLPELHEDRVYQLTNVVTDEYEGRYSVKLNRTTGIEEVDIEMEVGDDTVEVEGALVDIQSGSGLIKRCPNEDCTRVLQNGRCSEHGDVEGEFDLRIKGVLDDGDTIQEVLFDCEATETLTGITLDEAQQMAMDALDTEVVGDEMRERTLGQYYRVAGPVMGRYLLADDFDSIDEHPAHEDVLIRARSI